MLEIQSANCVHTSITRESVMISSTQVLFAEKCPCMNAGSDKVYISALGHNGGFCKEEVGKNDVKKISTVVDEPLYTKDCSKANHSNNSVAFIPKFFS